MGSLPGERLGTYPPSFTHAGVDLFGPLTVGAAEPREHGVVCLLTLQLVLSTSE